MNLNTANKLTILRFFLALLFVILFYLPAVICRQIALYVFAAAAITDFLDGYIARKYNQITELGKLMDPLADKVLVFSALVLFVEKAFLPGWVLIIILSRDLMMGIFRAVAAQKGVVIAADIYGKIKTITQMIGVVVMLFAYAYNVEMAMNIGKALIYIATVLTVVSGANYLLKNKSVLSE